jgi:hypothetical protein
VGIFKELKQVIVSDRVNTTSIPLNGTVNNTHKMEVDLIAPKIPYRETITKMLRQATATKNNPEVPTVWRSTFAY